MRHICVKDVNQTKFVKVLAAFFKKSGKVKQPELVDLWKTATYKVLAPTDPDWYYTRLASIARHLYIRNPTGVNHLAKIYGGRKRNGTKPSHFCKSSTGLARRALQTLEQLKLVEKDPNGGRRLTSQGQRDLDRIANQIAFSAKKNRSANKAVKI